MIGEEMRRTLAGAVMIAALSLAGCAATPTPFDREPTADDVLPPTVEDNGREAVEESTIRFQGSTDTADVWMAMQRGGQGVCLIVVATDPAGEWTVGCSGGGGPGGVSMLGAGEFECSAQGIRAGDSREGWVALSDYVIARE